MRENLFTQTWCGNFAKLAWRLGPIYSTRVQSKKHRPRGVSALSSQLSVSSPPLLSEREDLMMRGGRVIRPPGPWLTSGGAGLGVAAISYVAVDYLRHVSPPWHARLQPLLWAFLALASVARAPFYRHWSLELKSAIPFVASMIFMLFALLLEAFSVRFVTAVLGLDWHQ